MREWLSGGAPPCQGGGRGFDPRLALEKRTIPNRYRSFFRALPGLESSMSTLRSGPRSPRSPGPRAPSRASFICSGSLDFTGFPLFYVVADLHPPAPSRFIASAIMLFLIILCFLCCFPGHQSCRRTSENKFTTGRKSGLWLSRYSLWNGSFQG